MIKYSCLVLLLLLVNSVFAQTEIKEYQAQDSLYMVGDRVYSLYYITPEGVVVIDPINDRIAAETMNSIRRHTNLPVKYVIYSHNHWDHNSGGKIYKDQGAKFIAHTLAAQNMSPNEKVVSPDSLWNDHQSVFSLGGKDIELYYYSKNHGDGMTVFRFPEYNTVFTVDLVVPDRVLYAYLPDAKPQLWLETLYEMEKLDFDQLLMAHVRPIGTRKDLDLQIQYFEDLYAAVDSAMKNGTPFFEIPKTVQMPQHEELMNYDEWLHMNVWRILMEKAIGQ
ncbi:MBL fold metallo-hydrolase [Mangrovibacterium diazotrophicum]|uniref:Glyoxylase-like metal-dependent hydrolase (Beta-lactamase superfamily II) n=1 Tax=Mangrovibacterium diazotrophicum TaxID=1261403 RepID=A0A419W323_9BACT|nr:MBL fold metallo-hydrolase [Mangrovibacterium diazotrophicum]RKD89875.1 glyoxylase-like metal-dependent hydrolase (beta-lactamase superfamily II) [Mangrovibacterium diazotrophicum]